MVVIDWGATRAVQVCQCHVRIGAKPCDVTYTLSTQLRISFATRRVEDLHPVRLFLSRMWTVRRAAAILFNRVVPYFVIASPNNWPHATLTMPPLPSTTQTLTNRLNALSESNKSVLQLIQRLSKLDFQPGSTPLNAEEGDARLELSAEIHETLKGIEDELELLRQEVEDVLQQGTGSLGKRRDSSRESERSRLAVLLARLTEDLRS